MSSTEPIDTDPCPIHSGDVLADRYRIEKRIGDGTFSWVFSASELIVFPGRRVALKVLRPEHAKTAVTLLRFQDRELALLHRVEQAEPTPNVVRLVEPRIQSHQELPFLVLELIEGPSLKERLTSPPDLSLEERLLIGLGIARGLEALHACGIVHRDIKPGNIRLRTTIEPVIVDLGIAAALDATTEFTATGQALMTPRYASPEQQKQSTVGPPSDIYTLSLVFRDDLKISPALGSIGKRCLQGQPEGRPSAAEVAAAIEAILQRKKNPPIVISRRSFGLLLAASMCALLIDQPVAAQVSRWERVASMVQGRFAHTATQLANGHVLVIGGYHMQLRKFIETAEVFDPDRDQWLPAGILEPRKLHQTMLLPNGDVLLIGGVNMQHMITDAWKYSVVNNSWTTAGVMTTPRTRFTVNWLPNANRMLVAGGRDETGMPQASTELYDPGANHWTIATPMLIPRADQAAVWIPSIQKLLVIGGTDEHGVSLASAELYEPISNTWSLAKPMSTNRDRCTATLLPDNRVLVAGGTHGGMALASAEMYDAATGKWQSVTSMHVPRSQHTATPLENGRVLVMNSTGGAQAEQFDAQTNQWILAGTPNRPGIDPTVTRLKDGRVLIAGGNGPDSSACDIFDPRNAQWALARPMEIGRYDHTMTLLPDGRVLVVGAPSRSFFNTAEIYDPRTNTWAPPLTIIGGARYAPTATLLPESGDVLIAGGGAADGITESTERFNHARNEFVTSTPMSTYRHAHTATRLPNGEVLIVGGYGGRLHADIERYDPVTDTWKHGAPMFSARTRHAAALLLDGRVLVVGGIDDNQAIADTTEIYDPVANTWMPGARLETPRYGTKAIMLRDGRILLAGGFSANDTNIGVEIYDPKLAQWITAASMGLPRRGYLVTMLRDGRILVAGGMRGRSFLDSAEIYDPASNTWTNTVPLKEARSNAAALLLPDGRVIVTGGLRDGVPLTSTEIYEPV